MKLKNCPFCGGNASMIENREMPSWRMVMCFTCGIRTAYRKSAKEAAEDWNRRPKIGEEDETD